MAIYATNEGGSYEPVPAGNHVARCISMIHLGTLKQEFQGKQTELNKIRITWELPEETKVFKEENGEQPYTVSKEFTLSMNEKANLRKFLESWRGKGFTEEEAKKFDVTKLLGVPCMLSVIHKTSKQGKTYADISAVSTLPKKTVCPEQVNPSFEFNFYEWNKEKFESLPDWLKDKMKQSKEYKFIVDPTLKETPKEDDEPDMNDIGDNSDNLPF